MGTILLLAISLTGIFFLTGACIFIFSALSGDANSIRGCLSIAAGAVLFIVGRWHERHRERQRLLKLDERKFY